jgi:pilus assembly protein CpaB
MFFRNVLLIIGGLCILLGLALGFIWIKSPETPLEAAKAAEPPPARTAILTAAHPIPSGTLLQAGDTVWKEVGLDEARPENIVRGQVSETEFLGAIARRDFLEGESLTPNGFLKLSDRRFLAAVLKPGSRAISIAVDAAQSASGLILPGNHVDVILTQNLGGSSGDAKRGTVAETILRDVRVIAVDQALNQQPKTPSDSPVFTEVRLPKTVTLELSERQAEMVFVALQLGSLQLAVRPFEMETGSAAQPQERGHPTWSFDVSPALREILERPGARAPSGSTIESAIRRPPAS